MQVLATFCSKCFGSSNKLNKRANEVLISSRNLQYMRWNSTPLSNLHLLVVQDSLIFFGIAFREKNWIIMKRATGVNYRARLSACERSFRMTYEPTCKGRGTEAITSCPAFQQHIRDSPAELNVIQRLLQNPWTEWWSMKHQQKNKH